MSFMLLRPTRQFVPGSLWSCARSVPYRATTSDTYRAGGGSEGCHYVSYGVRRTHFFGQCEEPQPSAAARLPLSDRSPLAGISPLHEACSEVHSTEGRADARAGCRSIQSKGFFAFAGSATGPVLETPGAPEDPVAGASSQKAPKICILGGGFGGLYTAVKLDGLMWPNGFKPEVTLIDKSDRFVFKPLLYEILTGEADELEVSPFFKDVLSPFQTHFVQARVVGVDIADGVERGGAVLLSDGQRILYDWLVIAMGAETDFRGIPGVMRHAVPFHSVADAQKILSALHDLVEKEEPARAVVVGGGYAGVELAAAAKTKLTALQKTRGSKQQITVCLVTDTPTILPMAPFSQRHAAEAELKSDGVEINTGYFVQSIRQDDGAKVISLTPASAQNGREATEMEADLIMWTAGNTPSTSDKINSMPFPFERTSFGCLRTDPTLRLIQEKRVFALGDDAVIEDPSKEDLVPRFPATAQVALQQADYVAWNLWSSINNRALLPFRYQHLGDMMSLGIQNAAIALPLSFPKQLSETVQRSPLSGLVKAIGIEFGEGDAERDQRVTLDGPLAALVRRAAYWYRQPTNEQRSRILRHYFGKVARAAAPKRDSEQKN